MGLLYHFILTTLTLKLSVSSGYPIFSLSKNSRYDNSHTRITNTLFVLFLNFIFRNIRVVSAKLAKNRKLNIAEVCQPPVIVLCYEYLFFISLSVSNDSEKKLCYLHLSSFFTVYLSFTLKTIAI